MEKNKIIKKLKVSMITIISLTTCLCITTFALYFSKVLVKDNFFQTGAIKINLNDGQPIIEEHEFLFEPGMLVKRDFFIENIGSWDVYYKLYFNNIDGDLGDILHITVSQDEDVIYSGFASEFTKQNVKSINDILEINEKKTFSIYFYYPKLSDNDTQNLKLSFELCADAVQTKNNPNKEF